jgi:hypothetical protein
VDKRGDGHKRVLPAVSINSGSTTRFGGADAEHLSKRCIRWKEQRVVIWRAIRMATNGKWSAAAVGGWGAHSGNSRVPGDYEGGREDGKGQSAHPRLLAVNQLMRPPTDFFCM